MMYKVVAYLKKDTAAIAGYKDATRYAWEEHLWWTRNAMISIMNKLGDVQAVVARLMKNQEDIGNLLRPYYAEQEVDTLVNLLKQHVTIAGNIFTEPTNLTYQQSWQINGDEIVYQLARMNPNCWITTSMAPLWKGHMEATINEAVSRTTGDWEADISYANMNHDHIVEWADRLSTGTINYSLESFCTAAHE